MGYVMGYIFLAVIVFIINLIPAFMPPTWTVLAFTYIKFHLLLLPIVFIGAVFATLGRIGLYYLTKHYFHYFFPNISKKNMKAVGRFFNARLHITIPLLIAYAFIPIPSNQIYIAAGLADLDIRIMAASFFVGRLVSYSFWVGTTGFAVKSFHLSGLYPRVGGFIVDILGFVILYLFTLINWEKIFVKIKKKKKVKRKDKHR